MTNHFEPKYACLCYCGWLPFRDVSVAHFACSLSLSPAAFLFAVTCFFFGLIYSYLVFLALASPCFLRLLLRREREGGEILSWNLIISVSFNLAITPIPATCGSDLAESRSGGGLQFLVNDGNLPQSWLEAGDIGLAARVTPRVDKCLTSTWQASKAKVFKTDTKVSNPARRWTKNVRNRGSPVYDPGID